jgi:hypothetical protein
MVKIGSSFLKVGRAAAELDAWDRKNLMIGRVTKILSGNEREVAE